MKRNKWTVTGDNAHCILHYFNVRWRSDVVDECMLVRLFEIYDSENYEIKQVFRRSPSGLDTEDFKRDLKWIKYNATRLFNRLKKIEQGEKSANKIL